MEPRGPISHTATAMDPVHGSQFSVSSTDITLIAQREAVLRSSYGSESMGEVSTGTASMAFTGQRNQPMDAARQLLLVDDSGSLGPPGPLGLPGTLGPPGPVISLRCRTWGYPHGSGNAGPKEHFPSGYLSRDSRPSRASHLTPLPYMGIPPWKWKCRTQGAFPFRVSLACPGPSPPSRELGHARDSPAPLGVRGIFRVGANASHQAGTAPPQGSGNGAGPGRPP